MDDELKSVRAAFCISSIEGDRVRLEAVMDDEPVNAAFFAATPEGTIDLQLVNPSALAFFRRAQAVDATIFVDFSL